ncbi:hypothetical protein OSCI_1820005 [Kamptonema sp. PCC 6506]|nr:hypothetical protein OSCI_1820005 [Kamptonema sp. PCC 6506]
MTMDEEAIEELIEEELNQVDVAQWTPNLIWAAVDSDCQIHRLSKAKKQAVLESTELYQDQ